mgnify:CR=1 FL=1
MKDSKFIGELFAGYQTLRGSAERPAWAFQQDEDTGVYQRVPGEVNFVSDGVEVARTNADGVLIPLFTTSRVVVTGAGGQLDDAIIGTGLSLAGGTLSASPAGHTIRENGTDQTARTGLNFIDTDAGAGLITDDGVGNETEVNLSLYRLEAADHSHQSTGLQAGQLDHGLALTGLTDDDHTQYLLVSGTRAMTGALDMATFGINNAGEISMQSTVTARMEAQNRFRHLNSLARASRSTNQTISNATYTQVTFDTSVFDTDALFSDVNDEFSAAIAGKYLIEASVQFAGNATGRRAIKLTADAQGTTYTEMLSGATSGTNEISLQATAVVSLAAAAKVELFVYQDSGGNLAIISTAGANIWMAITYLGE